MTQDDDDVFYGVPAIADAIKFKPRQVHHLKDHHGLPTFKIGRNVCARRGALRDWLKQRETAEKAS